MQTIASSEFGTTFYNHERIAKTPNYLISRISRNWFPENFTRDLSLIACSMANILAFLKFTLAIDESEIVYSWKNLLSGDRHWAGEMNPTLTRHSRIIADKIPLRTEKQIIDSYKP